MEKAEDSSRAIVPIDDFLSLLSHRLDHYFENRTSEKNGYLTDLLISTGIKNNNSIVVDDNDYLGIASCSEIVQAQVDFMRRNLNQTEVVMSGVFLGTDSLQYALQNKLANFIGMEEVYVTQSGFAANHGILQALCTPQTVAYIDEKAHASFIDGLRVSRAHIVPFKHNNLVDLEVKLKSFGSGVILVDSIYSGYGTVAPLQAICLLKIKYNCLLIVDESHSLGLYGKNGSGLLNYLALTCKVDFITASLSKAFCTRAGLIAGSSKALTFIREHSFQSIFSSAILTYDIIRIDAALNIITHAYEKRRILMDNCIFLRKELLEIGVTVPETAIPSPIFCLMGGSESSTKLLRAYLEEKSIFGAIFCHPATGRNESFVRLTLNANAAKHDLIHIVHALKMLKRGNKGSYPRLFVGENIGSKL